MFEPAKTARPSVELYEEYIQDKSRRPIKAGMVKFASKTRKDIYNITAPFIHESGKYMAGRVENRHDELSKVWLFVESNGKWVRSPVAPEFLRFQDPFLTMVGEEIIFGGVQIDTNPMNENQIICWRTLFFRGKSFSDMKLFARGPNGMKDIRVVGLKDGKIAVFTRPQGEVGGRGKIGYITLNSLDELNEDNINRATIYHSHFIDQEWGGVNEVHVLRNGLLGVLGHIARFDEEGNRYYYPMVFAFDPESMTHSSLKIIACRDDFLPSPAKRNDLYNVVFSGGLVRQEDGTAVLYAGVSDATAQWLVIPDPFSEYEV